MASSPLQILHLEDDLMDAALIETRLEAEGVPCKITRVCGQREFLAALTLENLDLILSDFSMPTFDGLSALEIARKQRPDLPFIFISGTIGEEIAVEALKEGATDYVLKDRMSRLPTAVQRAMREAKDAAQRRTTEERIREQAALLDCAQDAICVHDLSQQVLFWNKGAERLYGWTAAEVVGKNARDLLYQSELSGPQDTIRSLISQGEWRGELSQTARSGRKLVIESRWTLLRDANGKPKSILVINTDITERKRLEAEFLRNQRVETIGALTGGIAHDLNNALAPVLMGVSVLREEPISADAKAMLDLMESSSQRASEMVKQILSFSRGVGGQLGSIDIKGVVEDMVKLARRTFPRNIDIQAKISEGLPRIKANTTQVHQVLLNLCVNARDAMPNGGTLAIAAEKVDLKTEDVPRDQGLNPGAYVLLSVADTGHGIPLELLDKIFEPFFTTKGTGHGTGLGLSTVMGIIKTHGGFLDVASEPDRGTCFKVYLPAVVSG